MLRVIDTETCGLQGGIVEIASVDIVDGQITNPMSHLVRPDRPISPQAMAIHRITEEMVADKPWIEEIIPHYHGLPRRKIRGDCMVTMNCSYRPENLIILNRPRYAISLCWILNAGFTT